MTTKEFAQTFGMTVSELSEYSGYSRKSLYNIIEGCAFVHTRRYDSLLKRLKKDAWQKMCEEKNRVQKEYDHKLEVLKELKSRERNHSANELSALKQVE